MNYNIKQRAYTAINLKQYNQINLFDDVGELQLQTSIERQYILRMLIKHYESDLLVPDEYKWLMPLINKSIEYQKTIGINHPFMYLTIRNGIVTTKTDDQWHVDGFSLKFNHLPEQNYICCNNNPTQMIIKKFDIPNDFDASKHNLHQYFQDRITNNDVIETIKPNNLYCIDPYNIHKRNSNTFGTQRCFVRLSFTPIEINDINNTINPLLKTNYTKDGLKDFRNKLVRYE